MNRLLTIADTNDGFASYPFDFAAANPVVFVLLDLLQIGGDDLELKARTSRVQDEYVHERGSGIILLQSR